MPDFDQYKLFTLWIIQGEFREKIPYIIISWVIISNWNLITSLVKQYWWLCIDVQAIQIWEYLGIFPPKKSTHMIFYTCHTVYLNKKIKTLIFRKLSFDLFGLKIFTATTRQNKKLKSLFSYVWRMLRALIF